MRWTMLLTIALASAGASFAQRAEIVRVDPTVLVTHDDPARQEIRLTIENGRPPFRGTLRVYGGEGVIASADLGEIGKGTTEAHALLPEPAEPILSRWVLLDAQGSTVADHRMTWKPPRHWKLYVLKSAHIDIGLHAEQYLQRDLVERFTDEAMELSDRTDDWPPAARFRYAIEHMWWLLNYAADRPPEAMDRLVRSYVEPGRIGVGAGHSGNHTQELGTEELCRSAYYSRRQARDRWGLDLQCAVFSDINGLSWPVADVYADAGIRYLGFYPNTWRGTIQLGPPDGMPGELFYWLGPSGRSRVLVWACHHYSGMARRFGIPQAKSAADLKRPLSSALRALEAQCPYDVWLVPSYRDNEEPGLGFAELARQWNAAWRWPELCTVGDPAVPFREVEKRFGDRIPTRRGDITPSWAQHPVSTPRYLGRKRAADRLLTTAEKLATIARLEDPGYVYPTTGLRRAWDCLIQSDEHGYGVSSYSGKKVYVTWAHKRNWIDRALEIARSESRRALGAVAARIEVPDAPAVVVFNPLLHERTDLVSVEAPRPNAGRLQVVDADGGIPWPVEVEGGRVTFVAPNVPPLGYRVFRLVKEESPEDETPEAEAPAPAPRPPVLENRFYRVTFAPDGAIAGIFDKELERDIVDPKAPYMCNQFVFTWDDHQSFASPHDASFEVQITPLGRSVVARMNEEHSGAAITQRVTLPEHEKRIDVDNRLEHVAGLIHEPRYQAYGYYAFPFAVPEGAFRAQLNGCVARPGDDQCPIGTLDWLAVQDWTDVSGPEFGVTLAQRQSHLVEFGEIRTNHNSHDYRPATSHLYSYLFNDWYQKNWASPRDVHVRYQYSIRSHRGDYRAGKASDFGRRFAYPLMATAVAKPQQGPLPGGRGSFAEAVAPNVDLLTLKLSEAPGEGAIARLAQSDGTAVRGGALVLRWPALSRVTRCSVVEDDLEDNLKEGPASTPQPGLDLGPFEIATLRLREPGPPLPAPVPEARGLSDKAIRLAWSPVAGAAQYNVFRGPVPDFPADAYHLLATTTAAELVDDWLSPGVTWHYRVAALTPSNRQGAVSETVRAATTAQGPSPPSAVGHRDTGLISEPTAWHDDRPDTLHLLWGQNSETDLDHYELYRSRQPGFAPSAETLIATVPPGPFVVVSFDDGGLEGYTTYYYRVRAVDREGHAGPFSIQWSGTTRDRRGAGE